MLVTCRERGDEQRSGGARSYAPQDIPERTSEVRALFWTRLAVPLWLALSVLRRTAGLVLSEWLF